MPALVVLPSVLRASKWAWLSTPPGHTNFPVASISLSKGPVKPVPMVAIFSSSIKIISLILIDCRYDGAIFLTRLSSYSSPFLFAMLLLFCRWIEDDDCQQDNEWPVANPDSNAETFIIVRPLAMVPMMSAPKLYRRVRFQAVPKGGGSEPLLAWR